MKETHILVVEDDEDVRVTLRTMLEDGGYRVSAVGDGDAMLAFCRTNRADAIVLDATAPGPDGVPLIGFTERLGLPVLMVSGSRLPEFRDGVMHGFLPKPFGQAEFLAALAAVLQKGRAPESD